MPRFARIDKKTNIVTNIIIADRDWIYDPPQSYDVIIDNTEVSIGDTLNDGTYSPAELSEQDKLKIDIDNIEVGEVIEQIHDIMIEPSKTIKKDVLDKIVLKRKLQEQVT